MQINKTATTVEEQLEILKSRGLIIDNEEKAKEILLDIGYFRLGFYWFPFEKSYPRKRNRTHEFKEDSHFKDAVTLYYFDFDLRNLFLKYISRVEINFRTTLIYHTSLKYPDNPFWYVDSCVIKQNFLDDDYYKRSLKNLREESVISNDLNNHNRHYAPAWKALEFLSFGSIVSLFENLKDGGLKQQITKVYGWDKSSQFTNYLNTVRRLRNACAHGKVLYDLKLAEAISDGPLGYLGNYKSSLYGAYKVLHYLLSKVSYNRAIELNESVVKILRGIKVERLKQIISDNSGFKPNNI